MSVSELVAKQMTILFELKKFSRTNIIEEGIRMIPFTIDEIIPCLKNVETGDIVETEIVRLKRKSFLSKFNSKTGWYINWSKFSSDIEIYALVIRGTMDIQGLIALENDKSAEAVHIHWASVSPENNIWEYGKKKYAGVGGHLFAIAGNKSIEYGHNGYVYAEAMDADILQYYLVTFNAEIFPFGHPVHPYRFIIDEDNMGKITEEYNYEDSGEEI